MVRARQSTFSLEKSWRTTSSLENLDWMFPFLNIWHNFLLNEFQKPPLTFLGEVDCFKKNHETEVFGVFSRTYQRVSRGFLVRHARGVYFFSLSKSVFLFETLTMTNVNEKKSNVWIISNKNTHAQTGNFNNSGIIRGMTKFKGLTTPLNFVIRRMILRMLEWLCTDVGHEMKNFKKKSLKPRISCPISFQNHSSIITDATRIRRISSEYSITNLFVCEKQPEQISKKPCFICGANMQTKDRQNAWKTVKKMSCGQSGFGNVLFNFFFFDRFLEWCLTMLTVQGSCWGIFNSH